MTARPWERLAPGDLFHIWSNSREPYQLQFLGPVAEAPPLLYARRGSWQLLRIDPKRLDWTTLELRSKGDAVAPGDEVLVATRTGQEHRGALVEKIGADVVVAPRTEETGSSYSEMHVKISMRDADPASLRIVFPATRALPGDEFVVLSLSGNRYRGCAIEADPQRLRVRLVGAAEPMDMQMARLKLDTLRVLVPAPLAPSRAS